MWCGCIQPQVLKYYIVLKHALPIIVADNQWGKLVYLTRYWLVTMVVQLFSHKCWNPWSLTIIHNYDIVKVAILLFMYICTHGYKKSHILAPSSTIIYTLCTNMLHGEINMPVIIHMAPGFVYIISGKCGTFQNNK